MEGLSVWQRTDIRSLLSRMGPNPTGVDMHSEPTPSLESVDAPEVAAPMNLEPIPLAEEAFQDSLAAAERVNRHYAKEPADDSLGSLPDWKAQLDGPGK
jgi:hypothetical protein